MPDNPLNDFVELPEEYNNLDYSNIICGVIRGALSTVLNFLMLHKKKKKKKKKFFFFFFLKLKVFPKKQNFISKFLNIFF